MDHKDASRLDSQIRLAAFTFLRAYAELHGDTFPRDVLSRGFEFRGQFVKLVGPQGIFKPRLLTEYPLSLLTVAAKPGKPRPYDDGFQEDGLVRYRYRGTDPAHPDNVRVRRALRDRIPLVYFHGIVPGQYLAAWPTYVVADDPTALSFRLDVDGRLPAMAGVVAEPQITRRYSTRSTRQRLHQRVFRERVLRAYREQCAICRLRHTELLDAAHIVPDAEEKGEPRVSNGVSLCKLHHAAFDGNLFGVRPDFVVVVRDSILRESDGPMLRWGLQEIDGSRILLPRRQDAHPDPQALEFRYAQFLDAG